MGEAMVEPPRSPGRWIVILPLIVLVGWLLEQLLIGR